LGAASGAPTGLSFLPIHGKNIFSLATKSLMEIDMKITRAEVEHVARLARLELTEEEKDTFTGQMDAILAYVEKLNELDTAGIIPTAHAVPMENAFREDLLVPSIGTDNALANAPDRVEDFFRVPKVIE
jgi:aspartyl-tRNA(Asn)/glutamyl-tRNA(Gln) amidotransferase subunit C